MHGIGGIRRGGWVGGWLGGVGGVGGVQKGTHTRDGVGGWDGLHEGHTHKTLGEIVLYHPSLRIKRSGYISRTNQVNLKPM